MNYYRVEMSYSQDGCHANHTEYYLAESAQDAADQCRNEYKNFITDLHIQAIYREYDDCWDYCENWD